MNIYSFYKPIGIAQQPEEFACANLWKESWTKRGWNPVMLNLSHCNASPLLGKLSSKIALAQADASSEVRTRMEWMLTRFIRWCALHACGGGWMSDYDVVNLSFTPKIALHLEGEFGLHVVDGPAFLFYATAKYAEQVIQRFIAEPLFENGMLRSEASILNAVHNLEPVLELVMRAKKVGNMPKSEMMKEAML